MATKSKFSERGLNRETRVDVNALSPKARNKVLVLPIGAWTQNTTTKFSRGPLGFAGTLISASMSFRTLPAGGALTLTVVAYDASANAEIVLCDAIDPETGTVREAKALVLASTNVELAADDTIELHSAADNNAVGTAAVDGYVTLVFKPSEDTTIDD
jgi:hypothetical protein